jgi:hypothetical protein
MGRLILYPLERLLAVTPTAFPHPKARFLSLYNETPNVSETIQRVVLLYRIAAESFSRSFPTLTVSLE